MVCEWVSVDNFMLNWFVGMEIYIAGKKIIEYYKTNVIGKKYLGVSYL